MFWASKRIKGTRIGCILYPKGLSFRRWMISLPDTMQESSIIPSSLCPPQYVRDIFKRLAMFIPQDSQFYPSFDIFIAFVREHFRQALSNHCDVQRFEKRKKSWSRRISSSINIYMLNSINLWKGNFVCLDKNVLSSHLDIQEDE